MRFFQGNEAIQAKIERLKNQAEVFLEQGEKNKAKACYQKMLTLGRWKRGVQPCDLFEAHIKLGEIYASQSKFLRSTVAFKRALDIAEKKISVISPEVATALEKLAFIYRVRGEIQASREMMYTNPTIGSDVQYLWEGAYRRSAEAAQSQEYSERQQVIEALLQEPSEYPDRVAVLFTRSYLSRWNGSKRNAEHYCTLAYKESMRLQGETHPQTLRLHTTLIGLTAIVSCFNANVARNEKNVEKKERQIALAEEAIEEVKQVQDLIEQIDRLDLIDVLATIGLCYALQKRYDDAQSYFEQVLTHSEKYYGPDDNELSYALCNLAQCAYYQGRYDEAVHYDLHALAIREKLFGEKPVTGHILDHLVQIYEKQGNKQDLIERAKERVKPIRATADYQNSREYIRDQHESYRF